MHYDYLIAGAGLFGAVFAHEMHKQGRKVMVVEKRDHIAVNIYTEKVMGINVHRYGAHIFHTSDEEVWNYDLADGGDIRLKFIKTIDGYYPVSMPLKNIRPKSD